MHTSAWLTARDWQAIEAHGLDPGDVEAQLAALSAPPAFANLERPCTVGDGIERLALGDGDRLLALAKVAARAGRLTRFVPASGAATRMFAALSAALAEPEIPTPEAAQRLVKALERLPFGGALAHAAHHAGYDLHALLAANNWKAVLRLLLEEPGLGYAFAPKALLPFHACAHGARTAFEEHLREAAAHVTTADGVCRCHFTVATEHRERFAHAFGQLQPTLEAELGYSLEVSFSTQDPATDTLAGAVEGGPFRTEDGGLVFRPGGHGALLRNLQNLHADLVIIKNIDNILPTDRRPLAVFWLQLLTGLLVDLQQQVRLAVKKLRCEANNPDVQRTARALARRLGHAVEKIAPCELGGLLDRPLRVCGVVRNEGEPGGGPFWVRDSSGVLRPQIVEASQVDPHDPAQQAVWRRATHFNPVMLACAVRDVDNKPFELAHFVDARAVIVTRKSYQGRPLLALERPGLWNGGMAHWNTLFVEVPSATFAPVKEVFDLLRPEHQPPSCAPA